MYGYTRGTPIIREIHVYYTCISTPVLTGLRPADKNWSDTCYVSSADIQRKVSVTPTHVTPRLFGRAPVVRRGYDFTQWANDGGIHVETKHLFTRGY